MIIKIDEKKDVKKHKLTFSQKAADRMTNFIGSWKFILLVLTYIFVWVTLNVYGWINSWDPYPFIVLNLTLSCLAALQAPIILMSNKRQAEKEALRVQYDYLLDKKSEKEIEESEVEIEQVLRELREIKQMLKKIK